MNKKLRDYTQKKKKKKKSPIARAPFFFLIDLCDLSGQ